MASIEQQRLIALANARMRALEATPNDDLSEAPRVPGGGVEQPSPERGPVAGFINDLYNKEKRVSGLAGRAVVQGIPSAIAGLPALGADAYDSLSNLVIKGTNAVADTNIPEVPTFRSSRAVADLGVKAADMLDMQKPETPFERGAVNVGTVMSGALGGAGLSGGLSKSIGGELANAPRIGQALNELSKSPLAQTLGAGAGTVLTEGAQSMGVKDPRALLALSVLGAPLGGSMATAGERAAGGMAGLVQPFRSAGREVIAGKILNKFATNPGTTPSVMSAAEQIVPGSAPTIGQVSRDPGLVSAERGIVGALDNGQATSGRYPERLSQQNSARQAALDRITMPSVRVPEGGTPQRGTIEYATAKRDRAVDENLRQAIDPTAAQLGLADTAPVFNRIAAIRRSKSTGPRAAVQDAMEFAEERLSQPGINPNDPETLYSIRKDLQIARDGQYNKPGKSDLRLAKGELADVISSLDNAIDAAAPGYRKYLDLYAKRSRPLNQQEAITELRGEKGNVSASDPISGERTLTLGKFGTAARKAISSGALGRGVGNGNLSEPQMTTIQSVVDDLDRGAATTATNMKPPGSDTFKNLSIANVLGRVMGDNFPDSELGKAAQTIAKPLNWMYSLPDERVGQLIMEAVLDPKLGARFMRAATAHEVEGIAQELAKRYAAQTKAAAVYGQK